MKFLKAPSNILHIVAPYPQLCCARIEAFEVFRDMLPALVSTLEVISTAHGWSTESSKKASALLISITQFQMSLEATWAGWGFIKGLTISLQGQSKDICCAYNEIVSVKEALSEVCNNIDTYHKKLYDSVVSLGGKINALPPSLPWRCTHQMNRENVPSNTPEEYSRRAITITFFDDMISHLNNRFSDVQRKAIMALSIVPSVFMTDQEADSSLEEELIEHYHDDLPSPSTLQQELHMWKYK